MPENNHRVWWEQKQDELLGVAESHLNAYVYDVESIAAAVSRLREMTSVSRILYAVKANFNAEVLRALADRSVDFDCVSPGEVECLRAVLPDDGRNRILFTPNFAPREEYEWGLNAGVRVTLDSLYPLKAWPELFEGQELFIRMDPDRGGGHHKHVVTSGSESKFGVSLAELDELCALVDESGATITGIHAHSGSGILDPGNWQKVANSLLMAAKRFPTVRVLDLGGGIGVPDRRGDPEFDLSELDSQLGAFKAANPEYELWLEPGRYLVSQAGVLLTHVTQLKQKDEHCFVGVSTGLNSLIRPALYDAWHEIVNLTKLNEPATQKATVVGPICESGDKFGTDRNMPQCEENDVILVANAGAYGHVMSSRYNLRDTPPEIVI